MEDHIVPLASITSPVPYRRTGNIHESVDTRLGGMVVDHILKFEVYVLQNDATTCEFAHPVVYRCSMHTVQFSSSSRRDDIDHR